ncbi:hypothetical protein SO802_026972 [Lithocarpus litseifolius]|uniref:Uncharacterized protein n=1 Tax=Lithocarpus litseifolius TaxID=425828 RepID=A0AAW2C309_9ROSI
MTSSHCAVNKKGNNGISAVKPHPNVHLLSLTSGTNREKRTNAIYQCLNQFLHLQRKHINGLTCVVSKSKYHFTLLQQTKDSLSYIITSFLAALKYNSETIFQFLYDIHYPHKKNKNKKPSIIFPKENMKYNNNFFLKKKKKKKKKKNSAQ